VHELANGREDGGDGFIVDGELFIEPGFELRETARGLLKIVAAMMAPCSVKA